MSLSVNAMQNSLEPSPRASLCLALSVVLSCGLRMLVSILLHPLRIGWDPALHLVCANLICQGKLPYVDMMDVNPPLIWYLNTIPASLSALCGTPLPQSFNLFLLFLMIISESMCSYIIIKKLPPRDTFTNFGIVFGLLLFNFFLTVDFGQREEVFVLLFMPYFFLRMARWHEARISRQEAVIFGLVGAAGVCMKHYFVLNLLAVELIFFFFSRYKTVRERVSQFVVLENVALLSFCLLYLGHFFLLPSAVRHNYFDFLVPAFARGYYFWDTTIPNNMSFPNKRDVFLFFVASAALALPMLRLFPVVGALISFSLAGVVVYLLQFKGWAYQDIPVLAGGFMLAGAFLGAMAQLIVAKFSHRFKSKNFNASIMAYSLSVLVVGICFVSASDEIAQVSALPSFDMTVLGYKGNAPRMDIDTPFTDLILSESRLNDPILFISNAVAPGFPILLQLHRAPASRHMHVCILSVLQFIKSSKDKDNQSKRLLSMEPWVVQGLGEDIVKSRAPLVFLQDMPVGNDYLAPYNFVGKYLSNYKLINNIAGFSVYRREPGAKQNVR